jgi:hypothetical protein
MDLHLSALCRDTALMQAAATEGRATVTHDPTLTAPEHQALHAEVERLFAIRDASIS